MFHIVYLCSVLMELNVLLSLGSVEHGMTPGMVSLTAALTISKLLHVL